MVTSHGLELKTMEALNLSKRIESISSEIEIIKKLKTGPVSEIYLCMLRNIKAVLRVDYSWASFLPFDRNREIRIIHGVEHLELAPKILYHDASNGVLIWRYIEGVEFNFISGSRADLITGLGMNLIKLHQSKLPDIDIASFKTFIAAYEILLQEESKETLINKGFKLYNDICEDGTGYVLSHNDLNKSNLLIEDKFYFLDWEYAGLNHPYFDIATLCHSLNLSDENTQLLWNAYSNDGSLIDVKKLDQWILFIQYLDLFWRKSIEKLAPIYKDKMDISALEKKLSLLS